MLESCKQDGTVWVCSVVEARCCRLSINGSRGSQNLGYCFGSPQTKDNSVLGSRLQAPYFWNLASERHTLSG